MSAVKEQAGNRDRRVWIQSPQNLAAGLSLLAIAGLALWLARTLPNGTLNAMGPAMLPNWLAIALGACGLALATLGIFSRGARLEQWNLRALGLVMLAVVVFAATIQPFSIGEFKTPGLGLAVAGPLTILIGGLASPETRLRELFALALGLTAFCMLLFGDLLNLQIPLFPERLVDLFPAGSTQKAVLRTTAVLLGLGSTATFLLGGRDATANETTKTSGDSGAA